MNTTAIEARAALLHAINTGNVEDCIPAACLGALVDESDADEETRATLYRWLTDQIS
jgi:hypothetical protein